MDGGKQRMFCECRHRLSLNLPRIMDELIRSENHVWSVPGNNFAQVELVEEEGRWHRHQGHVLRPDADSENFRTQQA